MQLPIINFGLCKMKLLLPWAVALLCGSVQAQPPTKIQLVCVGWQPVYSSFDQGAMSHYTGDEKDTIVVKLDKVHGSASLPTQLGTVTAPLSETDQLILFG
jgi:hypothetical protein